MSQDWNPRRSTRATRGIFPRRYRDDPDNIGQAKRKQSAAAGDCLFQLPDDVWAMVRDLAGAEEAVRVALVCQGSLEFARSPGFWHMFEQPVFEFRNQAHRRILRFFVEACIQASWPLRELRTSYPYYQDSRGWTDYKRYALNQVTVETLIMTGKHNANRRSEFAENKVLDDFGRIHNLRTGWTDNICQQLRDRSSTQGLRLLELAYQSITDESIRALQGLPELHSLTLDYCHNLTDRALTYLRPMPRLATLRLRFCNGINGSGLRDLPITKLTFIAAMRANHLIEQIGSLTQLQELDLLGYCALSLADIDTLAEFQFRSLKLFLLIIASDNALQKLAKQTGLHSLRLRQCRDITTGGLQHLQRCPALEELYLEGCHQFTDLSLLSTFSKLCTLHLNQLGATTIPSGLPLCTRLQKLQLNYYKITDAIITELTQCSLQEIELTHCTFHADVSQLRNCRSLRELTIKLRQDPPTEALYRLRQARPDLRVNLDCRINHSPYSWDA